MFVFKVYNTCFLQFSTLTRRQNLSQVLLWLFWLQYSFPLGWIQIKIMFDILWIFLIFADPINSISNLTALYGSTFHQFFKKQQHSVSPLTHVVSPLCISTNNPPKFSEDRNFRGKKANANHTRRKQFSFH